MNSNLGKVSSTNKNVLNKCQIGFLTDNIYTFPTLTEQELVKKKGKAHASFIDFTKAFDSISQEGLYINYFTNI